MVQPFSAFNFEKIVTYQIVVPHSKDAFVFSVCRKVENFFPFFFFLTFTFFSFNYKM